MKTWTLLLVVVMMAVVMTAVAMEEEGGDDWFENMLQEYKRRPRPPPRNLSSRMQCTGYGKTCTIKNRTHNCCQGMGCYSGAGDDCYGHSRCICSRTPALKYIYSLV